MFLSGWEARAGPLSCSLGFSGLPVLPLETRLPQRSGQGALTRPWLESHHVATSQMCQDMAAREGTGLAEPWGVGPGEEPAGPFPVRGWALLPRGHLPRCGTKPEPRPPASGVARPAPRPIFHGSHPSIVPHTGCGYRRPHPETERPGSSESVCSHSWACPRGGSAWPRHSSPCQLPSVP